MPSCGMEGVNHQNQCSDCLVNNEATVCCDVLDLTPIGRWCATRIGEVELDRDALELLNARSLSEALQTTPGATTFRISPATTGFSLRGFTGRRLLLTQDGIRLNSPILDDGLNIDQGLVDLNSLDSVSVQRGPRPNRWGSEGIGGIVELRGAAPALVDDGARGWLQGQFGFAQLEAASTLGVDWRAGDFAMLSSLSGRWLNDYRVGAGFDDPDNWSYAPYGVHTRATLTTGVGDFSANVSGVLADMEETSTQGITESFRSRELAWLGYHLVADDGPISELNVKLAYLGHHREFDAEGVDSGVEDVHAGRLHADASVPIGDQLSFYSTLGFAFEQLDLDSIAVPPEGVGFLVDDSHHISIDWAPSVLIAVGTSTHIELGARLGWVRNVVPDSDVTQGATLQDFAINGGAELRQLIGDMLSARLAVSDGVRYPNLRDVVVLQRTTQGTLLPNPDLGTEYALAIDTGFRLELDPFIAELTGFYDLVFDTMVLLPTGELDPDNLDGSGAPLPYLRYENRGETSVYGMEAMMAFFVGDVSFRGGLAWSTRTEENWVAPIAEVAPLSGSFAVGYHTDRWSLEPYTRFVALTDGQGATDGDFAVIGLRGHVRFADWIRFVLSADNLVDEGYRTFGSTLAEPGIDVLGTLILNTP